MPNPVTQSILKTVSDPELVAFVTAWDALEELVIRVFRNKDVSPTDADQYRDLRSWLDASYTVWEEQLEPHWRSSRVKGEPVLENPFRRILSAGEASAFVGDWVAMRHLPAAREAINNYLLSRDS